MTDVAFGGGEPAIRSDIFELVSHARHLGYDLVCDGPWKEYTDIFGWDEFKPVPGKKVNQNTNLLSRKTNW